MADAITIKALQDASLDAKSLEEVVNGNDAKQVTTRLGETYPSVKKAIKTLFENGGLPATPFATKALMTASALVDGDYAQVTEDTEANNGLYVKAAGVWSKSKYNPLSIAKEYVESLVSTDENLDIAAIKDNLGSTIAKIDKDGELFLIGLDKSVQNTLNDYTDSGEDILVIVDNNENIVGKMSNDGLFYLPMLSKSVQETLFDLYSVALKNTSENVVEVVGNNQVNSVIYAKLPRNKSAKLYKWFADGVLIQSGSKSYLEITGNLENKNITASALDTYAGDITTHNKVGYVGGIMLESEGEVGTLYEGFVLSEGDDFNELDIIAPHKPLGRWFTTRTYLPGARGSDTLLGTMYDTDPYHTGYYDSNRGVPVGYDNMYVNNGYIRLQSRVASDFERSHSQGSRNEIAAMLSSVGAFSFYAGAEGTGETILEFKVRHSHKDTNPTGWHPSLWTQSSLPSVTYNSDEWDISEGTHKDSRTNYNKWGANGDKIGGLGYGTTFNIMDNEWHLVSAVFSHSYVKVYLDGELVKTIEVDANSFNEPAYALVSNHIYNGNYGGSPYNKAMWDMFTEGTYIDVDFIRVWRKQGTQHIKPLVQIPPVSVDYGSTTTITLPSKTELWGDATVLEHVQIVMTDENEPGGHHTQAYDTLPSFASYDESSRTLTVNTANQKSGRLNVVVYGYKQDGSSCSPARTYINVAPRINVNNISINKGDSYDLYEDCDCGVLVTDGIKRTKKITVLDLPVGVIYNDETGLLSVSKSAQSGANEITIQCVNSVNQVSVKQVTLTIK